ncbi:4Fe-4S single cluster domain-containing protein [Amycolatopsis sp. NPDC101161]|uniref:4Fe-4S single cluster domain-containing protein n=1 Tax=Amycolatopsis sp. NPDC101161 TaxID=3363940 RepID=UPI0037F60044
MTAAEFVTVAETHPACRVLGPGTRYVVWVQGCPLSCTGCVSPQWIPFAGGHRVAVAELAEEIAASGADGLTLSGGEPFAQAGALARLVTTVRARRDLSVLCYTGYTLEHLRRTGDAGTRALLSEVDILIDGPYIAARHGDLRWRASANQRVHDLTGRHTAELATPDTGSGLQIEVLPDGGVHWLGVPPTPGFRKNFERALGLTAPAEDR